MTVKELKQKLAEIDDEIIVQVYGNAYEGADAVWADIIECEDPNCPECNEERTCLVLPRFVIAAD